MGFFIRSQMFLNPCWQMLSCLTNVTDCNAVMPGCNACYIGETTHHLSARIKKHLKTDEKSNIFTHLVSNETCKALSTKNCFKIIHSASAPFRLKAKEAMHITWTKPSLNKRDPPEASLVFMNLFYWIKYGDSYMTWNTSFVSLKLCVGFSIFHSVSFLLKFTFLFNKMHGLVDFKTSKLLSKLI